MIHARPVGITPLVFMHKIGLAEKSCASNHAWSGLTAMSPIYRNHVDGRGHTRATVPRQAQAASAPGATPEGDGRRGHRPEPGAGESASRQLLLLWPATESRAHIDHTTRHIHFQVVRSWAYALSFVCHLVGHSGIRAASTRHSIESPHMGGASTRYLCSTGSGGAGRRAG